MAHKSTSSPLFPQEEGKAERGSRGKASLFLLEQNSELCGAFLQFDRVNRQRFCKRDPTHEIMEPTNVFFLEFSLPKTFVGVSLRVKQRRCESRGRLNGDFYFLLDASFLPTS